MSQEGASGGSEAEKIKVVIDVKGKGMGYVIEKTKEIEKNLEQLRKVASTVKGEVSEIRVAAKEGKATEYAMKSVHEYSKEVEKSKSITEQATSATTGWVKSLFGVGSSATAAGGKLAIVVTVLKTLWKVFLACAMVAKDFEWQMTKISIVADNTAKGIVTDMGMLREAVFTAMRTSVLEMREVTGIMYEFAAAGQWTSEEIVEATQAIVNLAMATGSLDQLNTVAKLVATSMHMFGEQIDSVTELADIMTKVAIDSVLTINDVGTAFQYIGPMAVMAGQDIEQMAAALSILSNQGFAASQAGRYLRQVFTYLADRTPETEKALRKLGIEVIDAQGNFRDLGDIVHDMAIAMQDLNEEERVSILVKGFGVWAGTALAGLVVAEERAIRSGGTLGETLNEVAAGINKEGLAAKEAERLLDTLEGQQRKFNNNLTIAKTIIGEEATPALKDLYEAMNRLMESEQFKKFLKDIGELFSIIADAITLAVKGLEKFQELIDKIPRPEEQKHKVVAPTPTIRMPGMRMPVGMAAVIGSGLTTQNFITNTTNVDVSLDPSGATGNQIGSQIARELRYKGT